MKLYAWGANSYGQLGLGYKCEQILSPELVRVDDFLPKNTKIKEISGGAGHTLILVENGAIYGSGWNHKGQLGLDNPKEQHALGKLKGQQPLEKHEGQQTLEIPKGQDALGNPKGQLSLKNPKEQHALGNPKGQPFLENPKEQQALGNPKGQLSLENLKEQLPLENPKGQSTTETPEFLKFTKINQPCDHGIKKISCGWDFSAAICKNNDFYVWGSNNFLQLGIKGIKWTCRPIKIEGIKGQHVSCGVRHMAILTLDNKILICGSGNKGQLGIDISQSELTLIPGLDNIIDISLGQFHTLALTNNFHVFSWGSNKFGQLGHSNEEKINVAKKIEFEFPAKKIYAGWTHSAVLTQNNKIYTFGRNSYGQLGRLEKADSDWKPGKVDLGNFEVKQLATVSSEVGFGDFGINKLAIVPTEVGFGDFEINKLATVPSEVGFGDFEVKQLAVGSEHNLAVTNDGKCFCWGWNEHGNCGNGKMEDVKTPQRILDGEIIDFVACGTGQSFAVTK